MLDFRPALQGITLGRWLRLLRGRRIAPRYWSRVVGTTLAASLNSLNAWVQKQKFGDAIQAAEIEKPVFILGHWRSGTTMLHELLAADPSFQTPGLYQVWNPHTFLVTQNAAAKVTSDQLDINRGFDRVQLGFDAPSEDEFALWHGHGRSDFMVWTFPQYREAFEPYLMPQQLAPDAAKAWQHAWLDFLKALVVDQPGATLLLKSPQHTARLDLLAKLFPDARFIHIARHPERVILSTQKLHRAMQSVSALGENTWYADLDWILRRYQSMYAHYFDNRDALGDRLLEVQYETFIAEPGAGLAQIYRHLERPNPDHAEQQKQLARMAGYQTNRYQALDDVLKTKIHEQCSQSFAAWGYQPR